MKNTLKRLLSLIIATFLILSFSIVPAFASSSPPTTWTPTSATAANTMKTITVNGVIDGGATVTAYQIVKGTYKDGKLTGYTLCDGLSSIPNINSFDCVSPTAYWITTIANYIQAAISNNTLNLASIQMTNTENNTSTYTAEVEAGEYIILVTKSNPTRVYNPAIVAVNVTDANLISNPSSTGGTVNMESYFQEGQTNVYIKSSLIYFAKGIINSGYINAVSFGATVDFGVDATIPSYSEDYTSVQLVITDDLYLDHSVNPPFLGVNGLTVKVDGSEVPQVTGEGAEAVTNYEVKYYKKNESTTGDPIVTTQDPSEAVYYEIEFADAFIRANGMKNVEVTYSSTLTDNAKLALSDMNNFVSNDTRATLRYSNDPNYVPPENNPNSVPPYKELSSETHTYTFGIDSGNGIIQTYELNKVNQAGGTYTSVLDNNDAEITKKSPNALAGATFTIYSDAAMNNVIAKAGTATTPPNGTSISDANGHIEFRGLGPGTYYVKETAAPSGYTLNENNYKIVISVEKDYAGSLTDSYINSYTVTTYLMGNTDTQIGSATYRKDYNADYTVYPPIIYSDSIHITPTVTPAEVVNTTLATLPTTGGVGTIVISVIAVLGMAIFLTVFVICKKRSSKKN